MASLLLAVSLLSAHALAQTTSQIVGTPHVVESSIDDLRGKPVEDVRVVGNMQVSTAVIRNLIRTREGTPYDPATVEEDYQRVFNMKRFANVVAHVEPTETGVVVVFIVSEQKQIKHISVRGNKDLGTLDIEAAIDLKPGEIVDRFRIAVAKQSIVNLYRGKNYPFTHVEILQEKLDRDGELVFNITEGPKVTVRMVNFIGNNSFTTDKLKDQIKTKHAIWIFRSGTLDMDTVDEDIAALRKFYEDHGFFDVRVGRKLTFSPDEHDVKVTFVIEEGKRYIVDRVEFKGNTSLTEVDLRGRMKLVEGMEFDNELLQRDIRELVKAYSPFGFIYMPQSQNPDYLRIESKPVFFKEAGKVTIVFDIAEGKPFKMGRILIKGNAKTQDKIVLREMRVEPGAKYNSGEIADAQDRLRGTPFFTNVSMTPIGDDPEYRDLLVEVTEGRTASINVGAGVNSNGGIGANLTYEQKNFDITNWPSTWHDVISDRSFTGAGQTFRASLEPGTINTNASILFSEPYLFDQPYSFTAEAYLHNRNRDVYVETHTGGRVTFGKRFDYIWSTALTLRAEDVYIHDIDDPPIRAPEIVEADGHHTLTTAALTLRRNTTNRGFQLNRGTNTSLTYEYAGAMGGEYFYNKITAGWDGYVTLHEDMLDRRTILELHANAGWTTNGIPFFERFYGGGIGSIRGFAFRGVSPRAGIAEDAIGGNFMVTGTAQISFPIVGDTFRGVVFTDVGTVESDIEIGTIRSSVGAGIRITLPMFGQAPIAFDVAYPITKEDQDETQWISFSLGMTQ